MLSPLGRKRRKGWKLPNFAPLTWNVRRHVRSIVKNNLLGHKLFFFFEGTFPRWAHNFLTPRIGGHAGIERMTVHRRMDTRTV